MRLAALAFVFLALIGAPALAQERVSRFADYRGYAPVIADGMARTSFYLPMRDGVRLAVDLYRPANNGRPIDGRFPVLWHHTVNRGTPPQDRPDVSFVGGMTRLVRHGYVVAVVARRGSDASFGARRGYHDRNEAQDAYAVTEWLAAQEWSSGAVGIFGCSNTGEAAMHAITVRPPSLRAAFAGCFSWDKYDGMLRGGIFANWGTGPTRTIEEDMRATPVDGDESRTLLRQAAEEHQQSTVLRDMWMSMPYRDSYSPLVGSRFWGEGSVSTYADQVRRSGVALYIVGGWRDDLRREGLVAFANVPNAHLVIGPWLHCQNDGLDLVSEAHRFFDHYLKGVDNGLERQPRIHYTTQNAGEGLVWRHANALPLAPAQTRVLHLSRGALRDRAGGPAARFAVNYRPACADALGGPMAQPCPQPANGPAFTSAPFARDTEITGSPIADLWIVSSAPDANIFAYIEDVAPDGSATPVTDGRVRASLRALAEPPYDYLGLPWRRAFREDAAALTPGEPANLRFDLFPMSHVFRAGHRLRVTIAGADYRERDRVESSPAPTIQILSSRARASTISLPSVQR
jgi:uncharacterized protein